MEPVEIRDELRESDLESLKRKRKIVLLSAIGLIDFSFISLYQTGVIRKLPDIPGKIFNTNKVNASEDAYMMRVPDGPVSSMVYSLNMILASAGGDKKSGRSPVFDILLGGTILANAIGAAQYLFNMVTKQKVICVYCVGGALINFISVPYIWPDFKAAFDKLFGQKNKEKVLLA